MGEFDLLLWVRARWDKGGAGFRRFNEISFSID
jgi:hypothetical protein